MWIIYKNRRCLITQYYKSSDSKVIVKGRNIDIDIDCKDEKQTERILEIMDRQGNCINVDRILELTK
jgi:hypothetical protein